MEYKSCKSCLTLRAVLPRATDERLTIKVSCFRNSRISEMDASVDYETHHIGYKRECKYGKVTLTGF